MKTFHTTTKITTILNNTFLLTSISWCKHYSVVSMSLKNDQCLWTPCISCYSWSLAMLVKKLFSPYSSIQPPFSKTFYFSQLSKPDWNLTFVLKEFPKFWPGQNLFLPFSNMSNVNFVFSSPHYGLPSLFISLNVCTIHCSIEPTLFQNIKGNCVLPQLSSCPFFPSGAPISPFLLKADFSFGYQNTEYFWFFYFN